MTTADTATAPAATAPAPVPNPLDAGSGLFRLYLLDVDSDPENPELKVAYKRGEATSDIQKRIRALLNRDEAVPAEERIYEDQDCKTPFELAPDHQFNLTIVRKVGRSAGNRNVLDKAWVAMVLADPNLTADEKIAKISQFT